MHSPPRDCPANCIVGIPSPYWECCWRERESACILAYQTYHCVCLHGKVHIRSRSNCVIGRHEQCGLTCAECWCAFLCALICQNASAIEHAVGGYVCWMLIVSSHLLWNQNAYRVCEFYCAKHTQKYDGEEESRERAREGGRKGVWDPHNARAAWRKTWALHVLAQFDHACMSEYRVRVPRSCGELRMFDHVNHALNAAMTTRCWWERR